MEVDLRHAQPSENVPGNPLIAARVKADHSTKSRPNQQQEPFTLSGGDS
jgi:hypothetical protein